MVKLFDYRLHITVQEQHSVLIGNSSETKVDDDEKLTYLLSQPSPVQFKTGATRYSVGTPHPTICDKVSAIYVKPF